MSSKIALPPTECKALQVCKSQRPSILEKDRKRCGARDFLNNEMLAMEIQRGYCFVKVCGIMQIFSRLFSRAYVY